MPGGQGIKKIHPAINFTLQIKEYVILFLSLLEGADGLFLIC